MPPKKKSKRKATKSKAAKSRGARRAKPKKAKGPRAAKRKPAARKPRKRTAPRAIRRGQPETQNKDWSRAGAASARPSGDLQGLSRSERAASESVSELIDEGNVFEAEAVAGVEEADDADEQEVHTHEVPEDDVPKEYLDDD